MDWANITARRDKKHLSFGIWCDLYKRFYGSGMRFSVPTSTHIELCLVPQPTSLHISAQPSHLLLRPLSVPVEYQRKKWTAELSSTTSIASLERQLCQGYVYGKTVCRIFSNNRNVTNNYYLIEGEKEQGNVDENVHVYVYLYVETCICQHLSMYIYKYLWIFMLLNVSKGPARGICDNARESARVVR